MAAIIEEAAVNERTQTKVESNKVRFQALLKVKINRPTQQYKEPPIFSAKRGEDVMEWIERYEQVAAYNDWNTAKQLSSVVMFTDGAARIWVERLQKKNQFPTEWNQEPQPFRPAADNVAEKAAVLPGFRQLFGAAFRRGSQRSTAIFALGQRRQRSEETPEEFYYDVMKLCDKVDLKMSDEEKIEYLYKGMEPTMARELAMHHPKTPEEILAQIQVIM